MKSSILTPRLKINPLSTKDNEFIFELVNTPGWLNFIGDRNVRSATDADAYIQKIISNPNILFWVVRLNENEAPLGIISFIKRDYLMYHDIGFAFLPNQTSKGYAYEATKAVLQNVIPEFQLSHILATTVPTNIRSIRLLEKFGFFFESEIEVENKKLLVYGTPTNKLVI
ncbi:hypothetical protein CAP36_14760 [Chitinophagaceae bacterium IBVUCB2]|nr:hypothetical protein CAP36_14760 [Chitinophagaceae bacterium IBVUCB2]